MVMGRVSKNKKMRPVCVNPVKKDAKKIKVDKKRLGTVIVVTVFVLYFIYIMIWQQVMISQKNKELKDLEEKINSANQRTEELEKELGNLDDPAYLEKVAREKLGLVRPNERVFVDANKDE